MIARVKTSTIVGVDAVPVEVEVRVRSGPPKFIIIGLGDGAIRESRDRVMTALRSSGFELPDQILVNLAPAELRKEGSSFDLAIAVAILVASGQLSAGRLDGLVLHGELSLDGRLKPIRGVVALTIEALASGARGVVIPDENIAEATLLSGIKICGAKSLAELVSKLLQGRAWSEREVKPRPEPQNSVEHHLKLSDVRGQNSAKRALLIAAAGGHNLLMIGPPGCGKSMLAERFASLLPPLSREEILEAVRIHSVAGHTIRPLLAGQRPFRAPHHE